MPGFQVYVDHQSYTQVQAQDQAQDQAQVQVQVQHQPGRRIPLRDITNTIRCSNN